MKKIISFLLIAAMLISSLAIVVGAELDADNNWYPVNDKWDAISRDGVTARFIIGGDIHMDHYNSYEKLTYTYGAAKQIGGTDALMIAGDLTHYGTDAEYSTLMEVINANTKKNDLQSSAAGDSVGTTVLSMGNHEFWSGLDPQANFTENTGLEPCKLYWISGVPVIALSPTENVPERKANLEPGNNYDETFDFLKASYDEIDSKGYNGAIVMIAHHRTPTDGKENSYYSQQIVDLMKAHPNTMVFTGHSHTWIEPTKEFIVQDAGFTQVRAGSLGNNYGGLGKGTINPSTGKPADPLKVEGDSNCSAVLVDVLADGKVKLRRLDIAKGKLMFPDEEFIIDPANPTYYMYESTDEGTYGYGAQKPSFPEGAKVTVEDFGNNSSVFVRFPSAVPATGLGKDFISEYRIRFIDPDGNVLKHDEKNYFRVANYRAAKDEGKDWEVFITGLSWDTEYTVEVRAVTTYDEASPWLRCDTTVNVGHGTPAYPAIPVIDFNYEDGSLKDQTGGHKLMYTANVLDEEVNGRKVAKFRSAADTSIAYEFTEEDYERIRSSFTLECYFNLANVNSTQVLIGGWDAARLGFKVDSGKLNVWASIVSLSSGNVEDKNIVSVDIEARKWYHAVAVCDGRTVKLYLNGELVAENTEAKGGIDFVSYEPDEEAGETEVNRYFCIGGGNSEVEQPVYTVSVNTMIAKATLYEGIMKDEDVKAAYDELSNPPAEVKLPFTDVKAKSWFADAVKYVYKKGLMNGKSDTTFVPNEATNRAMLVTILYRMEGSPEVTAEVPFTDLKQAWYKDAVAWAYENEIVNGTSATTFDPNGAITRQQMAAILYRYNTFKGYAASERAELSAFPDGGKVQAYAKEAMSWANAVGLITGSETGGQVLLQPRGNATRAQVATILQRYDLKY